MSEETAMSEETTMSEKTAMSKKTAMSDIASANGALSYTGLLSSREFVLDCWRVYPMRNLIQHLGDDNECRQLEPRLMRLLCLLAASADAVVDRDEIITVLWPRVVVNENSLTRAVSDLRRTLTPVGDKRTALIQTIPKRGYRLTQAPADINAPACPTTTDAASATVSVPGAPARRWISRWTPSIAASFILALALVLRVGDDVRDGPLDSPLLAQLSVQPAPGKGADTDPQSFYDRVIDDARSPAAALTHNADTVPASLLRDSEAPYPITRLGDAPAWQNTLATDLNSNADPGKSIRQSMLTPDGQLLAYVDYRDGISSLSLRPAMTGAEPWVAFTTDERIVDLQWSPLDAGILLTVGQTAGSKEELSYLRLMLLDLETLTVQELYRRELPTDAWSQEIGNLT